jgi:hypothetical protein
VKWRQGGTHKRRSPCRESTRSPPTGRTVKIPEHYFYRVAGERIVMIRPEVVLAERHAESWEQIGVPLPPLRGRDADYSGVVLPSAGG